MGNAEGHAASPLQIAFDLDDGVRAPEPLTQAGESLIAPTTETPWRSLSARLAGLADLQLTLCEELGDLPQFPGGG